MTDERTVLVCMPVGPAAFTDNEYASCATCGKAIMHRPHVPANAIKMCEACAFAEMNKAEAAGDIIEVGITPETRAEFLAWREKND